MDRRGFLKLSVIATGVAVAGSNASQPSWDVMDKKVEASFKGISYPAQVTRMAGETDEILRKRISDRLKLHTHIESFAGITGTPP